MFTVIGLFKRRPGMTMDEFIHYYENFHSRLGKKAVPTMVSYRRRYLHPVPYPIDGSVMEPEYDVITEMSYADRAAFEDANGKLMGDAALIAMVIEDEEKLFDRSKCRLVFVEDHETDMSPEQ